MGMWEECYNREMDKERDRDKGYVCGIIDIDFDRQRHRHCIFSHVLVTTKGSSR